MKKNGTVQKPKSDSTYAKRQCRRAERIIAAYGMYDDAFRDSVQNALEQYKKGQPSNLPNLIKEADEIHRQHMELSNAIHAQMEKEAEAQIQKAMKAVSENPKKKTRRPRRNYETVHVLTALEITEENSAEAQRIKQALLLWSGLMLEISPGFMGRLYEAVANDWCTHVRGVIYEIGGPDFENTDERDRTFVTLNSVVLEALRSASGKERGYPVSTEELGRESSQRAAVLRSCADLFRRLAKSAENSLSGEAKPLALGQNSLPDLISLHEKLDKLERLPENEAQYFRLLTEIHNLENEVDNDEWPDVIE